MKLVRCVTTCIVFIVANGAVFNRGVFPAAAGASSRAPSQGAFLVQSDAYALLNASKSKPAQAPELDMPDPEGGINPFENNKQYSEWRPESKLPWWLQYFLVACWVGMLASIPFMVPLLERKPVTNTHMALGGTMLVVLFGGFWLFTNIILFQSGHFKRIRPLNNVECIYFMAQVITTVGYGDVTPAKVRGQVFVGLYVIGALFVIAMLVSDMTRVIVNKAKPHFVSPEDEAADPNLRELVFRKKPSPSAFLISLGIFAMIDMAWILFFTMYPGEGKTFFQALYMSVITLSTVGFGFFTPQTEEGMIFGAFMMFFGAGALGAVISNFTALMVQMSQWERLHKADGEANATALLKTQLNGDNEISEAQFLRFLLLQSDPERAAELNAIAKTWKSLNPGQGKLALKTVEDILTTITEDPPKPPELTTSTEDTPFVTAEIPAKPS